MKPEFTAGLMLVLSLVSALAVTSGLRDRQEMQAIKSANESVGKIMGDLTVTIAEKDREIERLSGSPCSAGEKSHVLSSPAR